MKKGSEWFKLLSEKEQQEFKENCIDFELIMKTICDFSMFIEMAFAWNTTPQGANYWCEISERQL